MAFEIDEPETTWSSPVDNRKTLSVVSALEIQRIVIGGIEMNDVARTQTNPNLRC